jgi:hypothetical protein
MSGQPPGAPTLVLCPGCCTIDDILAFEYDPAGPSPQAACARCAFAFPLFPSEAAQATLDAMRRHDCRMPGEPENWTAVGKEIIRLMREQGISQGELAERLHKLGPDDKSAGNPQPAE